MEAILGLPPNVETGGLGTVRQVSPTVQHYVLPMYEVAAGRYVDVPVVCQVLMVESTYPVRVYADGQPVVGTEDLDPFDVGTAAAAASFQPRYDTTWAGYAGRVWWPGKSFTIRREFHRLSVLVDDPGGDFAAGRRHGVVHIWLGSRDIDSMGYGPPVNHVLGNGYVGAATLTVTLPVIVTVSNFGVLDTPSRLEIYGATAYAPTWAGAVGVLSNFDLRLRTSGVAEVLTTYAPGAASWEFDFGQAVEVSGYNCLPFNAGDQRGLLEVSLVYSQQVTAASFDLRCKSFL